MTDMKNHPRRVLLGAILGAILAQGLVYHYWGGFVFSSLTPPKAAFGIPFLAVLAQATEFYGSAELALVVQLALSALFGGVVSIATLPFADDGRELICRSLVHYAMTVGAFTLLLWVGWRQPFPLVWIFLLTVLYLLIWLGRWVGWYLEVIQLRALLGLDPGPTPLHWRETLPYLPFLLFLCCVMPVGLRVLEKLLGADIPVFTGLLYPFLILPVAAFTSGISLGKRQGVCPLYPVLAFLCYLPLVWLLFNPSALFHCFLAAVPALAGNLSGAGYRRVKSEDRR